MGYVNLYKVAMSIWSIWLRCSWWSIDSLWFVEIMNWFSSEQSQRTLMLSYWILYIWAAEKPGPECPPRIVLIKKILRQQGSGRFLAGHKWDSICLLPTLLLPFLAPRLLLLPPASFSCLLLLPPASSYVKASVASGR